MKRSRAVFTMSHNETDMFPIWIDYYSRYFDGEDIYVIDHDSTDGSIEAAGKKYKFTVKRVHHDGIYNNRFILGEFMAAQRELLQRYDLVVCCDVDELILADPLRWSGLDAYLDNFEHKVISCNSRSVQQQPHEAAIDLTRPLLAQRSVWFSEYGYNKSVVSRVPLIWNSSFHTVLSDGSPAPYIPIDNDLVLLHLARLDLGLAQDRTARQHRERWDTERPEHAIQHKITGDELRYWFQTPHNLPIAAAPQDSLSSIVHEELSQEELMKIARSESAVLLEYIPERFKSLL